MFIFVLYKINDMDTQENILTTKDVRTKGIFVFTTGGLYVDRIFFVTFNDEEIKVKSFNLLNDFAICDIVNDNYTDMTTMTETEFDLLLMYSLKNWTIKTYDKFITQFENIKDLIQLSKLTYKEFKSLPSVDITETVTKKNIPAPSKCICTFSVGYTDYIGYSKKTKLKTFKTFVRDRFVEKDKNPTWDCMFIPKQFDHCKVFKYTFADFKTAKECIKELNEIQKALSEYNRTFQNSIRC